MDDTRLDEINQLTIDQLKSEIIDTTYNLIMYEASGNDYTQVYQTSYNFGADTFDELYVLLGRLEELKDQLKV